MFPSVKRARLAAAFFQERSANYIELAHLELLEFQDDLLKAAIGLAVLAVAGLLLISFASVAVIVTAWDTDYRIGAAWSICGAWAVLCGLGAWSIKSVLSRPRPFAHLTRVLVDDIQAVQSQA
jgi:uncharacterized membrane protein YqjE